MKTWTEDILLTHGHHVQSLAFEITLEWLQSAPADTSDMNESDNLIVTDPGPERRRGLSHENTLKVLAMCPNLCSLEISGPWTDSDANPSFLYTKLGLLLNDFPKLRHLELRNLTTRMAPDVWYGHIIKMLPLLETFDYDGLATHLLSDESIGTGTFASELAQLKRLSKLSICWCKAVNKSWCHQPWQAMLTHLTLARCPDLFMIDAQKLIEQFSPSLTYLFLSLDEPALPYKWPSRNKFCLPVLQILEFSAPSITNLLESFRDCKAIQRIRWNYLAPSEWVVLQSLVVPEPIWPRIKLLDFYEAEPHDARSWEINSAIFQLRNFCHQNHINFYDPGTEEFKN